MNNLEAQAATLLCEEAQVRIDSLKEHLTDVRRQMILESIAYYENMARQKRELLGITMSDQERMLNEVYLAWNYSKEDRSGLYERLERFIKEKFNP